MKARNVKIECPFCKGDVTPVYKMGAYEIRQCCVCGTGQVWPVPTDSQMRDYYQGFLFNADIKNFDTIMRSAPKLFSMVGLQENGCLKMLDIGGGGGFYAKAFELSGFGISTYVDLDSAACDFAKTQVGLKSVLNQDAVKLNAAGGKFDFIMCRHLIEHLVDPTHFILKLVELLAPGGLLLIVCPNGDSLEYLAYPKHLKHRIEKISVASELSKAHVVLKLLTGKMLHGIDPPRHLWAISRKGIRCFLKDSGIIADVSTFPLTDPLYSPYFVCSTYREKIGAYLGTWVASRVAGGTHLSVVIKKS